MASSAYAFLLAAAPGDGTQPRQEIVELLLVILITVVWSIGTLGNWSGVLETGPVYDQLTTFVVALMGIYIGTRRGQQIEQGGGGSRADHGSGGGGDGNGPHRRPQRDRSESFVFDAGAGAGEGSESR